MEKTWETILLSTLTGVKTGLKEQIRWHTCWAQQNNGVPRGFLWSVSRFLPFTAFICFEMTVAPVSRESRLSCGVRPHSAESHSGNELAANSHVQLRKLQIHLMLMLEHSTAASGAIFNTVLYCIINACMECQKIPEYGYF